jgi:ABC-2 type transport system permease protein
MRRSDIRKYWAFARIGFTEARAERAELYGRAIFLAMILGVFSALWRAVGEATAPFAQSPRALVFYLAISEWILLSAPQIQFQIEGEVRRGDVVYQLGRPVSYVGGLFAQALGMLAARSPVLLVLGAVAGLVFAGGLPPEPWHCLYAVPFGLAASVVLVAINVSIGLSAFWLEDIAPLHWVMQKFGFVLGGLLLPLEFYPRYLVRLAALTPFPSVLYGPASFVFDAAPGRAIRLGFELAGWFIVIAGFSAAIFRRAASSLQLNGG